MADDFWDQYQHPEWQRIRLLVLQRDNFACRDCGATDKTLHVHHAFYERGKKVWEYETNMLFTYCEECHENRTWFNRLILLLMNYMRGGELRTLQGFCQAATLLRAVVPETSITYYEAKGVANYVGNAEAEDILALAPTGILRGEDLGAFAHARSEEHYEPFCFVG